MKKPYSMEERVKPRNFFIGLAITGLSLFIIGIAILNPYLVGLGFLLGFFIAPVANIVWNPEEWRRWKRKETLYERESPLPEEEKDDDG